MSLSLLLSQCATQLQGEVFGADTKVTQISTDSRSLTSGDTFVALSGPNHDGHAYCAAAHEKGANALIVTCQLDLPITQLVVTDTRLALGALAQLWISLHQVPIVAITGSNGKTTVKEMIASILRELGPVLATRGNLNNEIGVPLTLLRLREEHQFAVIEMGANHAGEIGYLSKLASPLVAIVNNVSSAHLEGFGSLDAVARAKSEIFQGLDERGTAVINIDDAYADVMTSAASSCEQVSFGCSSKAVIKGMQRDGVFTIKLRVGEIQPVLQLLGEHNRQNAIAAAALASAVHVQPEIIKAGLDKVKPVAGRLQRKVTCAGATVIDDSYNANPASALAAIAVLAEQPGDRVLILGDMQELGDDAVALHAEVGNQARECGVDKLYAVGPLAAHAAHAFGDSGMSFSDKPQLLQSLQLLLQRSTTFLVKGSRGSHMEEVVNALMVMHGNGAKCEMTLS